MYCWAGVSDDRWKLLSAYQRVLPEAIFTGSSAAWLHGIDIDPMNPIEVVLPCASETRSRPGVIVHHTDISSDDVTTARDLNVTRPKRAFRDLRRRLSRPEFLIVADAALRLGLGKFDELAEPAESPMRRGCDGSS